MPKVKFTAVVVYYVKHGEHKNTADCSLDLTMDVNDITDRKVVVKQLTDSVMKKYNFADGARIYIQDINVEEGDSWTYLPAQ